MRLRSFVYIYVHAFCYALRVYITVTLPRFAVTLLRLRILLRSVLPFVAHGYGLIYVAYVCRFTFPAHVYRSLRCVYGLPLF